VVTAEPIVSAGLAKDAGADGTTIRRRIIFCAG
jgi:hypothetical protein